MRLQVIKAPKVPMRIAGSAGTLVCNMLFPCHIVLPWRLYAMHINA